MGIKKIIKNLIFKYLPFDLKQAIIDTYIKSEPGWEFKNISYSQEGEDLILKRLFNGKSNGFYVDVGAHHPYRFSNTYNFYLNGWRGINIDPRPGSMHLFSKERPQDTNLELGISEKEQTLTYYLFNDPALNTFDENEAKRKDGKNNYYITGKKEIKTRPLSLILSQHLPENTVIDFLTIDVEGFDLKVLLSNNWHIFKPKFILVEELRSDLEIVIQTSEVYKLLKKMNYCLFARTFNTSFYRLAE